MKTTLARCRRVLTAVLSLCGFGVFMAPAHAVPAFARQTGQDCIACHVGGFGPQLTPFGRAFKLGGYTLQGGQAKHLIPLSAMLVASYSHTTNDSTSPPAGFSANDNFTALQQASVFLAGRLSDHVGVLGQATYSDPGSQNLALDNTDVRYARDGKIGSVPGVFGVSLNNNPTVSDVWNTVPAWQFGFMTSPFGAGYGQTPMIEDLGGKVLGATAYTLLDDHWYLEAGAYHQLGAWWGRQLHTGGSVDQINANAGADPTNNPVAAGGGMVSGYAPYWRVNYSTAIGPHNIGVGLLGMNTTLTPAPGSADDTYRDIGVDASYQYLNGGDSSVTVNGLYLHERQSFGGTYAAGGSSNSSDTLDTFNLNGAYWWRNTYGATIQMFNVSGSTDPYLYGAGAGGSGPTNPQTSGVVWELDWNPFGRDWNNPEQNLRVGLQYTTYNKFQGASAGASGNNTLFLYLWAAV